MKTYKQPNYMGGDTVLAKDVPNNYYAIYFPGELAYTNSEVEILKHENSPCFTKDQVDLQFNCFSTKEKAHQAQAAIVRALRGARK